MTKDDLKATITVPEVLRRYGVEIRRGRCRGFCHSGRDWNMGVYEHNCHCFVCDKDYDIFAVVEYFENCSFKRAFEILGGDKPTSFAARRKAVKMKRGLEKKYSLDTEYWQLFDLWCAMDYAIILYNQTDEPDEELTAIYIYALHNINRVQAEADEVKDREWNMKSLAQTSF